jgi:hypothetical protein
MFCKVCFDASKSDYKTHNVKDSASNVVCPLLLNTKCNNCGYFGHTTKYCKLGGNQSAGKAYVRPAIKVRVPIQVPKKKGAFACLEDLDDDICQETNEELSCEKLSCEKLSREKLSRKLSPRAVEELDFDKEEIIWGVGFKSMIGKRWADVVGC